MQHGLAAEWQRFRADPPGERFCNHYQRAQDSSKAKRIAQLVGGVLLIAVGIVLCFVPGPGLLVMLFGFALLSTLSRGIARTLDRVELAMRRLGRRLKRRWQRA
jgi:uncharacterized membrane protein HdeD (DUF308 family)